MDIAHLAKVALVSALPVSELRGAIPLGILAYRLPLPLVLFASITPNIFVPYVFFLLLGYLEKIFSKFRWGKFIMEKILARARRRSKKIENYEFVGLVMFVAIPLPMTGAWTGATVAYVLGMKPGKALAALSIGVAVAAAIVSALTLSGKLVFNVHTA